MPWINVETIVAKSFVCGYCGASVSSQKGYQHSNGWGLHICHVCDAPTFFANGFKSLKDFQSPGSSFGNSIKYLPKDIETLYNEARNCLKVDAITASILCSRKLLMNIAVSKGAEEGLKFFQYVDFISSKGFVPPDSKDWVDHIRNKGNEATHEIKLMERIDAEELITFLEMLLKFIYEFPEAMRGKIK